MELMITLLRQMRQVINSTKESKKHEKAIAETGAQPLPLQQQKDEGSPHGANIGLSRDR